MLLPLTHYPLPTSISLMIDLQTGLRRRSIRCVFRHDRHPPFPLYSSASFAQHHIANKESVGDQTASLFLHRNANLANLFLSCSWTIFAFLYACVPKIPGTRQVVMCETRNVRLSLWNCNKYVQVYRNLVTVTSLMTNRKGAVFVR